LAPNTHQNAGALIYIYDLQKVFTLERLIPAGYNRKAGCWAKSPFDDQGEPALEKSGTAKSGCATKSLQVSRRENTGEARRPYLQNAVGNSEH
jgi:hypothetical protein